MDDRVRRAVAVDEDNRSLGATITRSEGATFVVDRTLRQIHDLNHVGTVRVSNPAEIDAVMARIEAEYAGYRHRQVVVDPETPPEFEARLVLDGYDDVEASLVMLLEGDLRAAPCVHPIVPVRSDADWDAYARLKRLDWAERAARLDLGPLPHVGEGLIECYRKKVPPLRYWLALADGEPRAFFSSWEGTVGVGQVEDLFVEKAYRHRGLATALLHHTVADARAAGAGPIAIIADATDTPKTMYAAMGFRAVATVRKYTRHL